ncbi:ABC1 kinase family protein [Lichenicoccus sp.]|uniref:ABC1 kinase family protein n=1 Tax=Lichenicoccus sp. TaxID=2781899 RepID=UPI003D09A4FE
MAERDLDRAGMFGELRRLARTSGAVGGIAARLAGERFGVRTNKTAHAEDLRAVLGGLKGPLMKVAQLLSTIPDALPDEYAAELAQLQANAPAMGWSFVRRRMAAELGADWEQRFAQFGREAAAAASLGQVHRATLPDGRDVACKLQYPDMPTTVEADLRQLRVAMGIYHRMDNAIQQDEIYKELAERLREELDYEREAAHLRLYRLMLGDFPLVTVPEPVESHSTKRLLTMQWVQGKSFKQRLEEDPSQESRNRIAEALFGAWYRPLYGYGVIHGDPHLGNFLVRDDDGLNLLDFGAIRIFPSRFVRGIIDLYTAIRDDNQDLAHHAYETWGFTNLSREKMEVLNGWARFLYEPLLDDQVRPIQFSPDPQYGRSVVEKVHAGLKRTGGVKPPREFVLMDRSAVGLGSVFLRLGAKLNWSRMFNELIENFNEAELAERQRSALAETRVPPPLQPRP